MKKKEKLLICDLDGTLFDTRRVNFLSYVSALQKAGLPVNFDYDTYLKEFWGPTYRYFCRRWACRSSLWKKCTI